MLKKIYFLCFSLFALCIYSQSSANSCTSSDIKTGQNYKRILKTLATGSFTLVNANSDIDLSTINEGDVISVLSTLTVNIRYTPGQNAKSIRFYLNGSAYSTENTVPYSLAGDSNGDYKAWNFTEGNYTLTANEYSQTNGTGTLLSAYTVHFSIKKGITSIIQNSDFESSVNFTSLSSIWKKEAYLSQSANATWSSSNGRNNSGAIILEAAYNTENDIAATQQIHLTGGKSYRLSAWVKTSNVQNGYGANICLFGTWERSIAIAGTNDWQKLILDFLAPSSGEVTIACRLGYWSGTSLGKAFFDDVQIEELTRFTTEGNHIKLITDQEDITGIQSSTLSNWIANLDKAYISYTELMGGTPYNGQKISISSVAGYPGGWAVAGNPILWYKPYVKPELQSIEANGNWSFGILHELGHDFVLENSNKNWIWNEEMFANLRMYYVVEQLNASVVQDKLYAGSQLKNYYKTFSQDNYDNTIAAGVARGHDGLMYTLIRIKDIIGWQPFKNTFNDLNTSTVNPSDAWAKFNLLLDKLTQYSGNNVRAIYPSGELDVIRQLLGGQAGPVVTHFNFIDADTDLPFMSITNGSSIPLSSLPPHINIEAVSSPSVTGSVKFIFDNKTKIENQAPYSYFGDNNGNFNSGTILAGNHSLSGQAFTGANGTGNSGGMLNISFIITNSNFRIDNATSDIPLVTHCYPNPTSDYLNISVKVKAAGTTKVNVFNPIGERKISLFNDQTADGQELQLIWDVRNENKGVYLLTIESNEKLYKEKLIIK